MPCLCTFPRSSAGEEKAMTFTEQRGMPGVCLGISLALSHSILKVSVITPFTEEKSDAQRAQSWGSVSSLCPQTSPVPQSRSCLICQWLPTLCLLPWPSSCPTQWIFLCPHGTWPLTPTSLVSMTPHSSPSLPTSRPGPLLALLIWLLVLPVLRCPSLM